MQLVSQDFSQAPQSENDTEKLFYSIYIGEVTVSNLVLMTVSVLQTIPTKIILKIMNCISFS